MATDSWQRISGLSVFQNRQRINGLFVFQSLKSKI